MLFAKRRQNCRRLTIYSIFLLAKNRECNIVSSDICDTSLLGWNVSFTYVVFCIQVRFSQKRHRLTILFPFIVFPTHKEEGKQY